MAIPGRRAGLRKTASAGILSGRVPRMTNLRNAGQRRITAASAGGQWEAPSFLRRSSQGGSEASRERRPRFERPSRDRQGDGPANDADPVVAEASEEPVRTE